MTHSLQIVGTRVAPDDPRCACIAPIVRGTAGMELNPMPSAAERAMLSIVRLMNCFQVDLSEAIAIPDGSGPILLTSLGRCG